MSDALSPLRHAYDVDPLGAPLAPGGAGHAEREALSQLRAVLEDWPAPAPSAEAREAVRARAAVVTAVVEQTDAAVAQAVAARPQPAPSAAVLAAVLARAAEPSASAQTLPADSPVEAAVLDQSAQALDRLPRPRPDASVLAAVEAHAAIAASDLAPVRALYLDAPAVDTVEGAVLAQSRAAVERALAARPQPRPSATAVGAVLARAAEVSGVEPEPVLEVPPVEAAVFAQSYRALDRLPRSRPSAATLDAVRLAAATAGAAPAWEARPTVSPDRAPARPSRRRTPIGVWAGAGTFLVAALALLVVFPFGASPETESAPAAAFADAEVAEPAQRAPIADAVPVEEPTPPASLPSSPASPLAGAAAIPGLVPAVQQVVRQAAPAPAEAPPQAVAPQVAAQTAPEPSGPPPSWDATDDVRALSLRLQDLDEADALAWDEAPAEAFGVPASPSAEGTAGIQSVREGAPARARFRSDSSSVQR